jgi:hypothetical protein
MPTNKRLDLTAVADAKLYPDALRTAEEAKGRGRRIGVALSGGGIRSATLSLGFFQGLAQHRLAQYVDYLSTVSGGGYFGGFFGHLLHRPPPDYTGDKGARTKADDVLRNDKSAPMRFLRENGRYLSPNGAGDLLSAAAGMLRNWFSVLVVLGLAALLGLTLIALVRYAVENQLASLSYVPAIPWPNWLSPLVLLLGVLIPILVVPPAWSYWLVRENPEPDTLTIALAKWAALFAGVYLLYYSYQHWSEMPGWSWQWVAAIYGFLATLTVLRYLLGMAVGIRTPQEMRDHMNRGLTRAMGVLSILAGIALIDTIGQALVVWSSVGWAAGYAAIAGVVSFFRERLLGLATNLKANEKTGLPTTVLIAFAAAALIIALLGGIASIPHFVAQWATTLPFYTPHDAPEGALRSLAILAAIAGALSFAVSRVWSFVNRSSMHAVYEARIRRAYLGASNPARVGEGENRPAVTDPHPDDGLEWNDYDPSGNGGPIHLVNVTINETVDGTSQVQQRDRKGTGMAIGPAGVSVGRTHHALWSTSEAPNIAARAREFMQNVVANVVYAANVATGRKSTSTSLRFRVFPDGATATPEPLDVGQWVAISGGAVSTGLGARTNMALSILIGFFNVRLGYWWQSGVDPHLRMGRTHRSIVGRLLERVRRLLPVQSSLMDEWLARFPGVARPEWNLTDGGHFENMGAYELLRRRMPLIIVCDNEEDSEYTFSGLANLVRKARTDLNAEITFLDANQVRAASNGFSISMPEDVASLDELRRGKHTTETFGHKQQVVVDALQERLSWAHASVAKIEYKDVDGTGKPAPTYGCLLYVKPTLTGDEPVDVLQYHNEHPQFPQEPTSDQFFDEAQWESYRRLGEHIASKLFDPDRGLGKWMQKVAGGAAP